MNLTFNQNLIQKNDVLVIATSGGIDSMVLLHYLKSIEEKYQLSLFVAHMNHHKREAANQDQQFVEIIASKWNLPYECFDYETHENQNFHHDARMQRMENFYQYAQKVHANKIVFAHHLDDQAETILMRLVRGSSLKGYAGIQEISKYKDLYVIHPILHETKERIREYQKLYQVPFVEDESNAHDDYTRNRYRHYVLPFLKKENPKVLEKMDQFSQSISEAFDLIDSITDSYFKTVDTSKSTISLFIPTLSKQHLFIQKEVIRKSVNHVSNNQSELSKINLDEILRMLQSEKPNLSLRLDDFVFVKKSYDTLVFQNKPDQIQTYSLQITSFGEVSLPNNDKIIISQNPCNIDGKSSILWYNNLDLLFPITVRNRRNKDVLQYPYGSKKVKDLFIDMKIPLTDRNRMPLLLNRHQEIICIPGFYTISSLEHQEKCYITYLKG